MTTAVVLSTQRFQVLSTLADGERVAMEVDWRGTLAVPSGHLPAGNELRARCAFIFELRHGKIVAQRNYDCYPVLTAGGRSARRRLSPA